MKGLGIRLQEVMQMLRGVFFSGWMAIAWGQTAAPTFEVASIKPHPGRVTVEGLSISGTLVGETAVDLMDLVVDAYNGAL
jgi:hypothetical protein